MPIRSSHSPAGAPAGAASGPREARKQAAGSSGGSSESLSQGGFETLSLPVSARAEGSAIFPRGELTQKPPALAPPGVDTSDGTSSSVPLAGGAGGEPLSSLAIHGPSQLRTAPDQPGDGAASGTPQQTGAPARRRMTCAECCSLCRARTRYAFATSVWAIVGAALVGGAVLAFLAYSVIWSSASSYFSVDHIIPLTPVVITPAVLVKTSGSYTITPNFPLYNYYVCNDTPQVSLNAVFESQAVVDFTDYKRSFTYYILPYVSYKSTISFNFSDFAILGRQGTLERLVLEYRQTPYAFTDWGASIFTQPDAGGGDFEPGADDGHTYYKHEYRVTQPLSEIRPTVTDEVCSFAIPAQFTSGCWPGHTCSVEIRLPESPRDDFGEFPTHSVRFVVSVSGSDPDVSQCRPIAGTKQTLARLPAQIRARTDMYNIDREYSILAQVGFFVGVCSDTELYATYGRSWGAENENRVFLRAEGGITGSEFAILVALLSVAFAVLLGFLLLLLLFEAPLPASTRVVNGLIRASLQREA